MKLLPSLLVTTAVFASSVAGLQGTLQIPSHVVEISKLEQAKATAKKEKKALAFVLTDPEGN